MDSVVVGISSLCINPLNLRG